MPLDDLGDELLEVEDLHALGPQELDKCVVLNLCPREVHRPLVEQARRVCGTDRE